MRVDARMGEPRARRARGGVRAVACCRAMIVGVAACPSFVGDALAETGLQNENSRTPPCALLAHGSPVRAAARMDPSANSRTNKKGAPKGALSHLRGTEN